MYAIVEIAGKQFKVKQDQYIYAPKMEAEAGQEVYFDQVLLVEDQADIQVGMPTVDGAKVIGKVIQHVKGDKVIVFKKKRRKGYRKKQGHRQEYTQVLIENILRTLS
jgi:large subunit ribosomal protein L21